MDKIKLIVGLGNPGIKYYKTRHNIGALYVKLLANRYNKTLIQKSKFLGYTTIINVCYRNIYLLIPNTFMNLSGNSVIKIIDFYNINVKEILVVHDDLDLPPGTAKIKFGGSNSGHNGLNNIQDNLDNISDFYRLRVGIGHPGNKNKVVDFVLEKPTVLEQKLINGVIRKIIDYTDVIFISNKHKVMSCFSNFKIINT